MAEEQQNQPQTSLQIPQFIMWDKVNGVFKHAKLKVLEGYVGHNLEQNVELQEPEISPDALILMSSVYLGAINIYEEQLGSITTKDAFQRLAEHKHRIVHSIIILAEEAAKQQRIPYFGVTVAQTDKDLTWKFKAKECIYSEEDLDSTKPKYNLSHLFGKNQPQKPFEFVLHPTAQLYVQRK